MSKSGCVCGLFPVRPPLFPLPHLSTRGNQNASKRQIRNSTQRPQFHKIWHSTHSRHFLTLSLQCCICIGWWRVDGDCSSRFPPPCPEDPSFQTVTCPRRHWDTFVTAIPQNWSISISFFLIFLLWRSGVREDTPSAGTQTLWRLQANNGIITRLEWKTRGRSSSGTDVVCPPTLITHKAALLLSEPVWCLTVWTKTPWDA